MGVNSSINNQLRKDYNTLLNHSNIAFCDYSDFIHELKYERHLKSLDALKISIYNLLIAMKDVGASKAYQVLEKDMVKLRNYTVWLQDFYNYLNNNNFQSMTIQDRKDYATVLKHSNEIFELCKYLEIRRRELNGEVVPQEDTPPNAGAFRNQTMPRRKLIGETCLGADYQHIHTLVDTLYHRLDKLAKLISSSNNIMVDHETTQNAKILQKKLGDVLNNPNLMLTDQDEKSLIDTQQSLYNFYRYYTRYIDESNSDMNINNKLINSITTLMNNLQRFE